MGWKNWAYWLKGGIIISVAHLIYYLALVIGMTLSKGESLTGWIFIFTESFPVVFIFRNLYTYSSQNINNLYVSYVIIFVINTIFLFIVGALIGWIVGIIKRRKN